MRSRLPVLAIAGAAVLAGSLALAQQPSPGQPVTVGADPAHPAARPSSPGTLPPLPGMGAPPGHGGPGMFPGGPPNGRPGRPGFPPPGGFPPGHPQTTGPMGRPGAKPVRHAVPVEDEEHGGEPDRECPGFGPDDAPPPMNYWHGMLMVDNDRATKPDFLDRLLFRYENPTNPCDPRNEPAPFLAALLNFGVLAFVLFRFGAKPLGEALSKRKQGIMAEIEAATKLEAEAEARLEDYEEKIENLDTLLAEMRADYAAQAETEQKHVLAEAEERRERMRRDAEFRIEQERKAVREALLQEAVIAATTGAEDLIRKQIAGADQDRMAADFLAAIGPAMRAGDSSKPVYDGGSAPKPPALSTGGLS